MCVFAVEFGGEAVQAAAQSVLVDLHQLLAFSVQLHTDTKLTLPVREKKRVARRKYRSAMGVAQGMVKGDMMRTNLMSSIMDLWRSNVVSDWQLAASFSLESGISDCSSPWPPSASLLTSDVSPLGSEVNSYSSSSSSSSSTFTSSSPLTGRTHSAIEN